MRQTRNGRAEARHGARAPAPMPRQRRDAFAPLAPFHAPAWRTLADLDPADLDDDEARDLAADLADLFGAAPDDDEAPDLSGATRRPARRPKWARPRPNAKPRGRRRHQRRAALALRDALARTGTTQSQGSADPVLRNPMRPATTQSQAHPVLRNPKAHSARTWSAPGDDEMRPGESSQPRASTTNEFGDPCCC